MIEPFNVVKTAIKNLQEIDLLLLSNMDKGSVTIEGTKLIRMRYEISEAIRILEGFEKKENKDESNLEV